MPRRRRRIGKLLFALPLLALTAAIVYGYVASSQPGTLVVEAKDSKTQRDLAVQAWINGRSVATPASLSLPQGVYTVIFNETSWYQTPGPRTISLLAGRTAYAVAEYNPIPIVIQVSTGGFDRTGVRARMGVTPVVWVNTSNQFVVLIGDQWERAIIDPNQNFTYVYQNMGTFRYALWQTDFGGTVTVV